MNYLEFYIASIVFFFALERFIPKRKQHFFRDEWNNDLIYSILNGHYSGTLIYIISTNLLVYFDQNLGINFDRFSIELVSDLPLAAQVFLGLLVKDFLSWCVHNLLHRVPFLWRFHRLHHSAKAMDFWVVMRFHWMEIVVYKTLLFIPLLAMGIPNEAFIYIIFIEVFWGFFNHANVNISIGWLKYIFNSPAMHIFHHEDRESKIHRNFGITLSIWDWLFKTAYWPEEECGELGFKGIEDYPKTTIKQYLKL